MSLSTVFVVGLRGFPNVQGGIEKHCSELYPRIVRDSDINVVVLCRANHQPPDIREYRGVVMRPLWSPSSPGIEAFLHTFLGVLYAIVKRPDLLHIHAIGPGIFTLFARMFGLKVVFTHHGFDYKREKWGRVARAILQIGERLALKFSNAAIAVSKVAGAELETKYRRKVEVIRNGVEIYDGRVRRKILSQLGLSEQKYVLSVSRIVEEKRQLDIVDAFLGAATHDTKLVIVGEGGGGKYYDQVCAKIKDRIDIVAPGVIYGDDLLCLYQNCAMFVHASSLEGNPIVVLEAMSFGLHLLVSDIDAHREIELDSADYFPLGDIEVLSTRLSERLARGDFKLDTKKQERIQTEFNWDLVSQRTLNVYNAILDKK
ncbi:MAG: glycosyltransferase family 4 protein [Pseudomonadota bacterium]